MFRTDVTPIRNRTSSNARFALMAALLFFSLQAAATTFTVGADTVHCNYQNLQDAINAMPAGDNDNRIHIANDQVYSSIHLTINTKALTLDGGYADCQASAPTSITILNASGHTGDSVIRLSGNTTVTISNVSVINGSQDSDSHGGGINFTGHGYMTLLNTLVAFNECGYGAGMNVSPDGPAVIVIGDRTRFIGNTADHSGGGIRVEGDTLLYLSGTGVDVSGNIATDGFGGGIDLLGPARVDIGTPGFSDLGVVYNNTAKYGGGISVTSNSNGDDALLRLYATDPTHPIRISNNRASETGGGIYLNGLNTGTQTARARVCAYDFRMDGNFAKDGTAIYANEADSGSSRVGSSVYLNQLADPDNVCVDHEPLTSAVRCNPGQACNSITGGRSEDVNHSLMQGAAVYVREAGHLLADNLQMRGNYGGYLLRVATNQGATAKIRNCLIVANQTNGLSSALVKTDGNSPISLTNCTFANNDVVGPYAFMVDDDFTLQRSIVNLQPGDTTFHETDGASSVSIVDVIANETASLNFSARVVADPRFVDPDRGDYHLQAASAAVDATSTIDGTDLDGLPRGINLPTVKDYRSPANSFGDLGAYEVQGIGNLVRNADFDTDLHIWTPLTSGISQWQPADPGSPTAYMRIYINPAANGDHTGLSQCVHLPGAADYQLTGLARGGSFFGVLNTPRLHWRFLASTDNLCSSTTPTGEGDLIFSVINSFTAPVTPAIIHVSPAQWGVNSAIEIRTVVNTDIGPGSPPNITSVAGFDAIALTIASDEIFKDGFE